ncbi:hypothetical protein ScPMuIL_013106 [Solemya velum]
MEWNVEKSFAIPTAHTEDSFCSAPEPIEGIEETACKTTYDIVEGGTKRGKRKLREKGDKTHWRCAKRANTMNCPATVIQNGDTYKEGSKQHIHPSEQGVFIAVKIQTEAKSKAAENIFRNPAPRVLDTDFHDKHAPRFFRDDVRVGNRRHLIFYTDYQLQLLSNAKTWYMDGTFRVVNKPWTQLFSIHAFVKSGHSMKQIPLLFMLMSGKRKEDYYEVFKAIDHRLPQDISLDTFVVDFEAGLWLALKDRFPGYPIQGCAFRWTQAVYRKIQDVGLHVAYNRKDDTHTVLALPFLPHEHIEDAFHNLDRLASTRSLRETMDYVWNTWIDSPIFKIRYWSIFKQSIGTNNDVEGWYHRLNSSQRKRARAVLPSTAGVEEGS